MTIRQKTYNDWPHRLSVRTAGFQSVKRSSTLRGVTREENSNGFEFSDTCDRRSFVSSADETSEPGSRKFPSNDEEIICDHRII